MAQRADRPRVELVTPGRPARPGTILLAATDDHLVLTPGPIGSTTSPSPTSLHYRPSVDVFFASVAVHWPDPGVAALLTGMGRDGAAGLLTLRQAGWHTIAQDEATSVVWGMPRAAAEIGAAAQVLPDRRRIARGRSPERAARSRLSAQGVSRMSDEPALTQHKVTVLLIDDQPMIGEAVRRMLAGEADIEFHYCKDATKAIDDGRTRSRPR